MPELPYFGTYTDEDGFSVVLTSEAETVMRAYGETVREACAKVAEGMADPEDDGWDDCLHTVAAVIRKDTP